MLRKALILTLYTHMDGAFVQGGGPDKIFRDRFTRKEPTDYVTVEEFKAKFGKNLPDETVIPIVEKHNKRVDSMLDLMEKAGEDVSAKRAKRPNPLS